MPKASASEIPKLRADLAFAQVYDQWFDEVRKWIRACGGPSADAEDLAQDVFLVIRRKLPGFDGKNLAGWLYRITARTVRDYRRSAWFRRVFQQPKNVPADWTEDVVGGPAVSLEEKERRLMLQRILARMGETRRTTFILFELEGYRGEEIAALQGIPVATVWTRLHHARKEFFRHVADLRGEEQS